MNSHLTGQQRLAMLQRTKAVLNNQLTQLNMLRQNGSMQESEQLLIRQTLMKNRLRMLEIQEIKLVDPQADQVPLNQEMLELVAVQSENQQKLMNSVSQHQHNQPNRLDRQQARHQHSSRCRHANQQGVEQDLVPPEHNHEGCQRTRGSVRRVNGVVGFTLYMIISTMYLNWFHLFLTSTNQFQFFVNKAALLFYLVLIPWAYYLCVTADNKMTPLPLVRQIRNTYLDSTFKNRKICPPCQNSLKPLRTSHCSACGQCSMRFDHHCVWTNNCIGYKNRQSFLIFLFYMSGGCWHFILNSVRYYRSDLHLDTYIWWWWFINSIIITPFTCMITMLLISHFMYIFANLSTIDLMKGVQPTLSCCQFRKHVKTSPFDRGLFKNFRTTLGSFWRCWFPHLNQIEDPLMHEQLCPEASSCQLSQLNQQQDRRRDSQMRNFMNLMRNKYKGSKLKLGEEQISIE